MMRTDNITDVTKYFGVTLQTVVTWCKRGCPHDEAYKGMKPVKKFNVEEVEQWLIAKRNKGE